TELTAVALARVTEEWECAGRGYYCVGVDTDRYGVTEFADAWKTMDIAHQRPAKQWWRGLTDLISIVGRQI
ncbi:MAG: hypothetical protein LBR33_08130, partial [Propionibacteriaceae bacterium]|nr:hypothetical protein [Propionibacteriaceae bacterium]